MTFSSIAEANRDLVKVGKSRFEPHDIPIQLREDSSLLKLRERTGTTCTISMGRKVRSRHALLWRCKGSRFEGLG